MTLEAGHLTQATGGVSGRILPAIADTGEKRGALNDPPAAQAVTLSVRAPSTA